MLGLKVKFIHFFRDKRAYDISDFIVTRIEENDTYFIHKARGQCYNAYVAGKIIDEETFRRLLPQYGRPIVLSNKYIDLNN